MTMIAKLVEEPLPPKLKIESPGRKTWLLPTTSVPKSQLCPIPVPSSRVFSHTNRQGSSISLSEREELRLDDSYSAHQL